MGHLLNCLLPTFPLGVTFWGNVSFFITSRWVCDNSWGRYVETSQRQIEIAAANHRICHPSVLLKKSKTWFLHHCRALPQAKSSQVESGDKGERQKFETFQEVYGKKVPGMRNCAFGAHAHLSCEQWGVRWPFLQSPKSWKFRTEIAPIALMESRLIISVINSKKDFWQPWFQMYDRGIVQTDEA